VDEPAGKEAWDKFLFNLDMVVQLGSLKPKGATLLCQQGHKWSAPSAWSTAKCSRVLHALTGVALGQSQFSQYRDCFLYSLAMLYDVEVSNLDLCEKSSEAAFALCAILAQYMNSPQE
jgi:hypothetical protein